MKTATQTKLTVDWYRTPPEPCQYIVQHPDGRRRIVLTGYPRILPDGTREQPDYSSLSGALWFGPIPDREEDPGQWQDEPLSVGTYVAVWDSGLKIKYIGEEIVRVGFKRFASEHQSIPEGTLWFGPIPDTPESDHNL